MSARSSHMPKIKCDTARNFVFSVKSLSRRTKMKVVCMTKECSCRPSLNYLSEIVLVSTCRCLHCGEASNRDVVIQSVVNVHVNSGNLIIITLMLTAHLDYLLFICCIVNILSTMYELYTLIIRYIPQHICT